MGIVRPPAQWASPRIGVFALLLSCLCLIATLLPAAAYSSRTSFAVSMAAWFLVLDRLLQNGAFNRSIARPGRCRARSPCPSTAEAPVMTGEKLCPYFLEF